LVQIIGLHFHTDGKISLCDIVRSANLTHSVNLSRTCEAVAAD
jgi:hypothetical protein